MSNKQNDNIVPMRREALEGLVNLHNKMILQLSTSNAVLKVVYKVDPSTSGVTEISTTINCGPHVATLTPPEDQGEIE